MTYAVTCAVTQDEGDLFQAFISALVELDPDVVVGWDIQKESLGYLAERWVGGSWVVAGW